MTAGERDRKVAFYRPGTATENGFGEPIAGAPVLIGYAWARVFYGKGAERRAAAIEGASQPATFNVLTSAAMRSVNTACTINFDGFDWEITGIAPQGRGEIDFTAVRRSSLTAGA